VNGGGYEDYYAEQQQQLARAERDSSASRNRARKTGMNAQSGQQTSEATPNPSPTALDVTSSEQQTSEPRPDPSPVVADLTGCASQNTIRKATWTTECAATIPSFDMVRERRKTVEDWRAATDRVLEEYWGPQAAIRCSLVAAVKLDEFESPTFDVTIYSVGGLLNHIVALWNRAYERRTVDIVLKKAPSESWCQYLDNLILWCNKHDTKQRESWFLDQMRGNITPAEDFMRGEVRSAREWAQNMDHQLSVYNRVHKTVAAIVPEEEQDGAEAAVDVVRKSFGNGRGRHAFSKSGKPICDLCKKEGHIARKCPRRSRPRGGRRSFYKNQRLVYSIQDEDCVPLIISVTIMGQTVNAMLDSGAMLNVIDIGTLRSIHPNITLQRFPHNKQDF